MWHSKIPHPQGELIVYSSGRVALYIPSINRKQKSNAYTYLVLTHVCFVNIRFLVFYFAYLKKMSLYHMIILNHLCYAVGEINSLSGKKICKEYNFN